MNTCKYKKICNRHSDRVINCNFPSICVYKTRYSNYDALFVQEAKGVPDTFRKRTKTRVSGFNLEEEIERMIDLGESNRYINKIIL